MGGVLPCEICKTSPPVDVQVLQTAGTDEVLYLATAAPDVFTGKVAHVDGGPYIARGNEYQVGGGPAAWGGNYSEDVLFVPAPVAESEEERERRESPPRPAPSAPERGKGVAAPKRAAAAADLAETPEVVADATQLSALAPSMLKGVWLDRDNGNQQACIIRGSKIIWAEDVVTEMTFHESGEISIELEDQQISAKLVLGQPARLVWSDGATWERDELQGLWCGVDGHGLPGSVVGRVLAGEVHWDERFCAPPSAIHGLPVLPGTEVRLNLDGDESKGIFHAATGNGQFASLRWDDGEVWVRSSLY